MVSTSERKREREVEHLFGKSLDRRRERARGSERASEREKEREREREREEREREVADYLPTPCSLISPSTIFFFFFSSFDYEHSPR